MEVGTCLGMDHDRLTTGIDVKRRHLIGASHHQMGFVVDGRMGSATLDDVGADRNIGHEHAVHHIPMDAVDSYLLEVKEFLAETGEIGGQNGWGDLNVAAHVADPNRRGRRYRSALWSFE